MISFPIPHFMRILSRLWVMTFLLQGFYFMTIRFVAQTQTQPLPLLLLPQAFYSLFLRQLKIQAKFTPKI